MADNPTSPLLGAEQSESSRPEPPLSQRSKASKRSRQSQNSVHSEESTPLLSRNVDHHSYGDEPADDVPTSPATSSLRSLQSGSQSIKTGDRKWATIVSLTFLSLVFITILGLGFAAPAVVEEYAKQAMVFEPTDLSIDSFTPTGVRARIKGDFTLDGSRVHRKPVRDLGRAGTWIARAVESRKSTVKVYLPEYDDLLLGTAEVPPIKVDIRDGHTTHIDFKTNLEAGDLDGIRRIANDWLDGRLGQLRVQGEAEVGLKSGIFSLGTQSISQSLLFEGQDLPAFPQYNITRFNLHEIKIPGSGKGMAADVSLALDNSYPVQFSVPSLSFDILVPNCTLEDPFIQLAIATTGETQIEPKKEVVVDVKGVIGDLPDTLTAACPNTHTSPLDSLLGTYIHGQDTTLFVRGSDKPSPGTPTWITDLIKSVVVPLPFPGHTFDNLMRNFSLTDVHFSLPNPLADPDTPEAQPKLSAVVKALIGLPKEINFPIDVSRVRADADVYYHDQKLGFLDLRKWQVANSTRTEAHGNEEAGLAVESIVKDAPLEITDDDVFTDVVQALIFGGKGVVLGIKAKVDVETETALGTFVVRDVPAQGKVFVKPISGGNLEGFAPKIGSLRILETTKSTLLLEAEMNITNPTEYSAIVPYVNVNLLSNGSILGHATARDVSVVPGPNHNIVVQALWDPVTRGGKEGADVGRELLSQYISGFNTTLTMKTHNGTIPTQPRLGHALSSLEIEIPTPKLTPPPNPNHPDDDDDDDRDSDAPHFIDDATFHLLTSTATFTLLSPLPHSVLYITHINATAYYTPPLPPGDVPPTDPPLEPAPVGSIFYEYPFAVPPGATTSPRLPVDWSLDSVGYEAVKKALGGGLRLDARAVVGVRVGRWEERVWFLGRGLGARVRI